MLLSGMLELSWTNIITVCNMMGFLREGESKGEDRTSFLSFLKKP